MQGVDRSGVFGIQVGAVSCTAPRLAAHLEGCVRQTAVGRAWQKQAPTTFALLTSPPGGHTLAQRIALHGAMQCSACAHAPPCLGTASSPESVARVVPAAPGLHYCSSSCIGVSTVPACSMPYKQPAALGRASPGLVLWAPHGRCQVQAQAASCTLAAGGWCTRFWHMYMYICRPVHSSPFAHLAITTDCADCFYRVNHVSVVPVASRFAAAGLEESQCAA